MQGINEQKRLNKDFRWEKVNCGDFQNQEEMIKPRLEEYQQPDQAQKEKTNEMEIPSAIQKMSSPILSNLTKN